MKKAGRSLATVLLLFVLSNAAFAGQMDTPPAPTPTTGQGQMDTPPAPTNAGGQMDTPPAVVGEASTTVDLFSEMVLDIWQFVPSLF